MEIHIVHPVETYKGHNIRYIDRDAPVKKNVVPAAPSKLDDQIKKTSPISVHRLGTKVAFSIEKDLHIVVTTVKDSNTNAVIRQIPPEETIDRLKLLNNYHKHT